ncbi:MAG TPA: DNA repair protein RadA [Rhizomicrobium sp.]|nr:DNA repair protein RadA [Rhizomicrobium sp.]
MAKSAAFTCQSCGSVHSKWVGKCESCGGWNTIVEEGAPPPIGGGASRRLKGRKFPLEDLKTDDPVPQRRSTGIAEFDRVTGGGLVPGSALLVGGDPGIGKSTLILQALGKYAEGGKRAVYISGEEALAQVRMRGSRLGLSEAPLHLGSATCVEDILATLESGPPPGIVAIDSIQTLWTGALDAAPGTVAQLRTASFDLVRYAKSSGAALLLVGHVTKDGQIAGPKAIEHLVDAVLYFEGERGHHFRILRAVKNRFGATDEIGVFEMTGAGLSEVANPSALFLGDRSSAAPGTAVFAGLEGTRPLLCEIQALVSPSAYGTPRRAVVGWDSGRLAMILAVLDARAGLGIGAADVYLNVAGGLKITEPAADLATAAALVSSLTGTSLPRDTAFFGEISLSGDIRPVPQAEARLKEAAKLGFSRAFVPAGTLGRGKGATGVNLTEIANVAELASLVPARAPSSREGARSQASRPPSSRMEADRAKVDS